MEMIGIGLIIILLINILNKDFISQLYSKFSFMPSTNLEISNLNIYIICICLILMKYLVQYFIVVITYKNLRKIH